MSSYWVPPHIREILGLNPGDAVEIEDTTPMPNLWTFARAIAKIAHRNAILEYGLDGFRPLALPDLILGRYSNIPFFVGSDPDALPPPANPSGVLHVATYTNVVIGRLKYMTARIRLFAHSGTNEHGMPFYEVVTGVEGKPTAITRRRSPRLPRTISL